MNLVKKMKKYKIKKGLFCSIFFYSRKTTFFCDICLMLFSSQLFTWYLLLNIIHLILTRLLLMTITCVVKDDSPRAGFDKYPGPPRTRDNRETGVKIQDINPNQESILYFQNPRTCFYILYFSLGR